MARIRRRGGQGAAALAAALALLPASAAAAPVETVTNTNDSGPGSLRQAIGDVDAGGTIEFALPAGAGEILLTTGELVVDKALAIEGPGPQELAVSGGDSSRVFKIGAAGDVAISGLTLTDGFASGGSPGGAAGGALLTSGAGALALTDVQVLDSTAAGISVHGGGIAAAGGSGELLLERVTLARNRAEASGGGTALGGGLRVQNRPTTLRNVTIANNEVIAGVGGGAMLEDSPGFIDFRLVGVTVAANSADGAGGGLWAQHGPGSARTELADSVVARNNAPSRPDCRAVTVVGTVLIQDTTDCMTDGSGTLITGEDPLLGPLMLNGPGQTETMALGPGSPALDAAAAGGGCSTATDQRGVARPQLAGCDLGAFEARPALAALAPGAHDFGEQRVGDGPKGPVEFTLSNDGDDLELPVDSIGLGGADAGEFSLDASDCLDGVPGPPAATLAPRESCTLAVRFDPAGAGQKQATLEIASSGGNPVANLHGLGAADPPAPPTPEPPAPDPPAPDPPVRSPALERFEVASRCVRSSRSGRVRVRISLRLARPGPVRLRIDRAQGTRGRRTCPEPRRGRRFPGRFREVRTLERVPTRPAGAAVTRRLVLNLRLDPGLYRLTARAHTGNGKLSKPKRRFIRVLG